MTDPQRTLAQDLLKLGLSQRGYLQATTIMDLENLLHEIEGGKGPAGPNGWPYRDPGQYFVSIFGEPSPTGTWGWRVEGHHLSIRFVVKGSAMQVSSTPTFFGSNPAEVRQGPKTGARVLGHQEDVARTLLDALSTEQKATALIAPMPPGEIATRTTVKVDPLTPAGLMASEMTPAQRDLLVKIIEAYTGAMTDDVAVDRMQKVIAAGIEKVGFAWAGSFERGESLQVERASRRTGADVSSSPTWPCQHVLRRPIAGACASRKCGSLSVAPPSASSGALAWRPRWAT